VYVAPLFMVIEPVIAALAEGTNEP
jgi:hypothetical protein